jgi:hypothetical protein
MKSIITKTLPVTNTKGLRLKADDGDGNTITTSYNYGLDPMENHRAAAIALANKKSWTGTLQGGYTKDGMCWNFVSQYLSVEV